MPGHLVHFPGVATMVSKGLIAGLLAAGLLGAACGGGDAVETPTPLAQANVATATPPARQASPAESSSPPATVPPAPSVAPTSVATAPATAVATAPAPTAAGTPAPQPTSAPRASAVALTFRAFNVAFDKTTVHVAAGATVTATLQNDDSGVQHNLTFSLPGLPHGETCTGPCTETQTFTASTAGSYFFLCTIHDMVGTFVVDP